MSDEAPPANPSEVGDSPQIVVSNFDYSVENHFKAVDEIDILCGSRTPTGADEADTERLSTSIAFLREWQDFVYEPRAVKFSVTNDSVKQNVGGEITLPQFSSASVPKKEMQTGTKSFEGFSRDYVMNVGGSVWGLDWCPKLSHDPERPVNYEFVAVAAHPPNSSYHKLGAPLTGRGAIQIWCFLSVCLKEDLPSDLCKRSIKKTGACKPSSETKESKPRGRPRKYPRIDTLDNADADSQCPKPVPKPRGRPRKYPRSDRMDKIDPDIECSKPVLRPRGRPRKHPRDDTGKEIADGQFPEPLAIECPDDFSRSNLKGMASEHVHDENNVKMHKDSVQVKQTDLSKLASLDGRTKLMTWKKNQAVGNSSSSLRHCYKKDPIPDPPPVCPASDGTTLAHATTCEKYNDVSTVENLTTLNIALPRMMLCLAHDGRVAWDLKWRPVNALNPVSTNALGFLAVLLGNGALEVWEVPHPRALKLIYPANQETTTDPRFIKLQPVFRCSTLKCGDRQSIPLTLEWSTTSPYDMILAGCHDGLVILWKFSNSGPAEETRPLLSFIADSSPIRTLAWAPVQSDMESSNIVVTAGHRGFKFWDIRDPFRPLWDHALQGITYSLDWLPDPRCAFGCVDDGTLWLISLENTPADLPVTVKSHPASSKQGLHSFDCSSFSIWSIQASRLTGAIAYCGEEGTTNCFQPTTRSVRDPSRKRMLHALCGSLSEEDSTLVVPTPWSPSSTAARFPGMKRSAPFPEKKAKKDTLAVCSATNSNRGDKAEIIETFPPEIVSLHRLRWSPNKHSERWLCYGGAAGLVRCQEVNFSIFHQ